MAVPKILTGVSYSEDELNELGYFKANSMVNYGKGARIENLLGVRCPTKYLSGQGISYEKEVHGNIFYRKDDNKEGHLPFKSSLICNYDVYENPLPELSVYGRGNNFILVNEDDGQICVQYKKNNSVLVDECIWGVSKELANYGFCSFMMKRETSDADIVKACIDMRMMGLVTQDQIFGLHNHAKRFVRRGKKTEKPDILQLIRDYEKVYPFIKEKLIICELEEKSETICERVVNRKESQRPLYPHYKFYSIAPSMESMFSE